MAARPPGRTREIDTPFHKMLSDDPLSAGDAVMVWDLTDRTDLNHFLAAVVHPLAQSDAEADPRIGVLVHNFGTERVSVKPQNLLRVNKEGAATLPDGRQMMPAMVMPSAPAPAPPDPDPPPKPVSADRRAAARATMQKMVEKHCPRPHYCIFCGSEGPSGTKCTPCGFYRGTFCFPPGGALQKGDTYMGRKLTFVKWPWTGDLGAPYVRAGAAADADLDYDGD